MSNEVDTADTIKERRKFYTELTGIELSPIVKNEKFYTFNDGRNDNRCMIIGHTDTAYDAIDMLRAKSAKKYKFYICVCIMHPKSFFGRCKFINGDEIYLSEQEVTIVEGYPILACEFMGDVELGFKATWPELSMYGSKLKGFHSKLDKGFMSMGKLPIKR